MKGTEKQIKWAEDIKARRAEEIRNSGIKPQFVETVIDIVINKGFEFASEWIDTRDMTIQAIMGYHKAAIVAACKR